MDTKYEFGVAEDGEILLIDEVKYIPKKEMPTISETFHFPFVLCVCVCVCVSKSFLFFLPCSQIHTPDSSRYWIADTYERLHSQGMEPENIDKEFLRLWFKDNCDPYNDAELPDAPDSLVQELSRRYITLYETITGETFAPASSELYTKDRLRQSVEKELK